MKAMLAKEEQDDINQRDWCKAETFKNEEEAAKFEYKVEKAEGKISKLEAQLERLELTLQETITEIETTQTEIAELEDERKESHAAFQESKADDEGAVGILNQAIEALSSFYKNNKGAGMGEIQGSVNLLQVANLQDPPPEASFSDAGKSSGESKGIVSILTMIKEDLQDEIANGVKAEEDTQKAFESARNKAQATVDRLTEKKVNTKASIATNGQSTTDTQEAKDQAAESKEQEEHYLEEIKPDCDWMLTNFQARKDTRKQEVDGLNEAIAVLNGAGFALVQSGHRGFLRK
jgi:chromosome segregation ATPase